MSPVTIRFMPQTPDPNSSKPPSVELRDVRLSYGEEVLFTDLALTLPAELWTCLLGPSGVGKTTLLRLVAGLVAPEGWTRIRARDGQSVSRRVAYMAQQDLLLPWLSVTDNVLLGSRLRGEPPAHEKARRLIARVGLESEAGKYPRALSGGQRQRAALARTLMEDRPIVLMDEPFSALDFVNRLRLQDLAAGLLARRTVLLVTHDPLEALRLGHRIEVLSGRPAVLDRPLEPAGAPPRDPGEPELLRLHSELLHRLRLAAGEKP